MNSSLKSLKLSIIVRMPGFLEVFGYYSEDLGRYNIDPTVQQMISSLMTIGTFISSLMVGPFSAKFGRRHGLWAATILNYVATSIQLGTTSKAALYVSRLILGLWLILNMLLRHTDMSQVSPSAGS